MGAWGLHAGDRVLHDKVGVHEPPEHGSHPLDFLLLGVGAFLPACAELHDEDRVEIVQKLFVLRCGEVLECAHEQFNFPERGRLELARLAVGYENIGRFLKSDRRGFLCFAVFDLAGKLYGAVPATGLEALPKIFFFDLTLAPHGATALAVVPVGCVGTLGAMPSPQSKHTQ